MNRKVDLRETVGMALCALLSLAAFLPLIAYGDPLPVALALAISLACPLLWFLFLLWSQGGGGGLVQRARKLGERPRPNLRMRDRIAGIPVEG